MKISHIVIILLLIANLGATIYFNLDKSNQVEKKKINTKEEVEVKSDEVRITDPVTEQVTQDSMTALDQGWNLFKSHLGFQINLPKAVTICDNFSAPLVVRNPEHPVITNAMYLPVMAECWQTNLKMTDDYSPSRKWELIVYKDIDSFEELERSFPIKHAIGEVGTCKLDLASYQKNIESGADQFLVDYDQNSCFINYAFNYFYSPKYKKAVFWDMGQEPAFFKNGGFMESYDGEMISSFKIFQ